MAVKWALWTKFLDDYERGLAFDVVYLVQTNEKGVEERRVYYRTFEGNGISTSADKNPNFKVYYAVVP